MESTSGDYQNRNPSVSETEASPSAITPKPFIKFVKAAEISTTNKVETVKKPSVKLGVKMGRSSPKNNYTHRSMPSRPAIHRPYRPPMRPVRPNKVKRLEKELKARAPIQKVDRGRSRSVIVTPPDGAWTEYMSGGVTLLRISSTKHKERPLR
nr:hypothetical protein [Tanacetum cinerariifolium]